MNTWWKMEYYITMLQNDSDWGWSEVSGAGIKLLKLKMKWKLT